MIACNLGIIFDEYTHDFFYWETWPVPEYGRGVEWRYCYNQHLQMILWLPPWTRLWTTVQCVQHTISFLNHCAAPKNSKEFFILFHTAFIILPVSCESTQRLKLLRPSTDPSSYILLTYICQNKLNYHQDIFSQSIVLMRPYCLLMYIIS